MSCETTESYRTNIISNNAHLEATKRKQRGAHVFGRLDSTNIRQFVESNIEWITLVPYASQEAHNSSTLTYYRGDSLEQVKRTEVWKNEIATCHSNGIKVFLKPHIWLHATVDDKWRSDIFPSDATKWKKWKKEYREFILMYAELAQENKVEMFCVGTELSRLSIEKPEYWKALIKDVRTIYNGKLTYAANWYKEYQEITFWEDLDFIGVQAYFPLAARKNPTVSQISKGWLPYTEYLDSLSEKYDRKILFTEMGYKSCSESAMRPWEWKDYNEDSNQTLSLQTQENCYKAFFNVIWNKDWFGGVHLWQYRSDNRDGFGQEDNDFTPQGKPAELIITQGFQ